MIIRLVFKVEQYIIILLHVTLKITFKKFKCIQRLNSLEAEVESLIRRLETAEQEQKRAEHLARRAEEQVTASEQRLAAVRTQTDLAVSNELRDTIEMERKRVRLLW